VILPFQVNGTKGRRALSPLNMGASEFVPGIIDKTTNPFSDRRDNPHRQHALMQVVK
jgi:hypothetical protein